MNRLKTLLLCLGSFWVIYSMSLLRIRLVNVPYPTILFHLNRIELNASQPFRKIDQLARQLVTPPTSKRPQLRLKNTANFFGYTAQVCFRGCMMCAMAVGEVYWMKTSKTCLDDARLVFSLPQRRVRSHRSCGDVPVGKGAQSARSQIEQTNAALMVVSSKQSLKDSKQHLTSQTLPVNPSHTP